MPRNTFNPVDGDQVTLRLKYGIHTVSLFVDPDWTFSHVTKELLAILRERYPGGLTPSLDEPQARAVPDSDAEVSIVYGVFKNVNDPSQGWKKLNAKDKDTVAGKKLTDQSVVAFALLDSDADEEDVQFDVVLPTLDDEDE
ncbi:hypothetical protein B0T22DRAFT_37302 [Podospora appendiculata]|uniref:Uncharacterized protein n=1 Tax=Podospora appendiculata TaxID=314037 RepID=A0AAE0XHE7_9PEZI|nr:hypothetical protein B0T22DRAFT_37302 [Podospora appendiculata]